LVDLESNEGEHQTTQITKFLEGYKKKES